MRCLPAFSPRSELAQRPAKPDGAAESGRTVQQALALRTVRVHSRRIRQPALSLQRRPRCSSGQAGGTRDSRLMGRERGMRRERVREGEERGRESQADGRMDGMRGEKKKLLLSSLPQHSPNAPLPPAVSQLFRPSTSLRWLHATYPPLPIPSPALLSVILSPLPLPLCPSLDLGLCMQTQALFSLSPVFVKIRQKVLQCGLRRRVCVVRDTTPPPLLTGPVHRNTLVPCLDVHKQTCPANHL